jgi:hypothetical protein
MSVLRPLDDHARVDAILDDPASPLFHDDAYRALWAANMGSPHLSVGSVIVSPPQQR